MLVELGLILLVDEGTDAAGVRAEDGVAFHVVLRHEREQGGLALKQRLLERLVARLAGVRGGEDKLVGLRLNGP